MDDPTKQHPVPHPSAEPAGGGAADALDETAYLLAHPANAARLRASLADARAGRLAEHGLIED